MIVIIYLSLHCIKDRFVGSKNATFGFRNRKLYWILDYIYIHEIVVGHLQK